MKRVILIRLASLLATMISLESAHAQDYFNEVVSMEQVLEQIYDQMMPLCQNLISVGQGIAGFAATWYIAVRVWRQISLAQSVDFFPLFRPFVIGFCIMGFPWVLDLMNGLLKPTITASAAMFTDSDQAIQVLLKRKQDASKQTNVWQMYVGQHGQGDRERWYQYTQQEAGDTDSEGVFEGIGNDIKFEMAKASYGFRSSVKEWLSEVLRIMFESAALCINTLRTFQLIVLSILGPLVFGISVFDGFKHTLTVWLARYINVFLWLPIANIFGSILGKIQENMLLIDLAQLDESGDTFFSHTDGAYLSFMIIGIIGYFTVPSVANYIVHASSDGALREKVTRLFSASGQGAVRTTTAGAGMLMDAMGNSAGKTTQSMSSSAHHEPYFTGKDSTKYMQDKLKGNT